MDPDEITGKSNSGKMVKYSGELSFFFFFYPPITPKNRILYKNVLHLICAAGFAEDLIEYLSSLFFTKDLDLLIYFNSFFKAEFR